MYIDGTDIWLKPSFSDSATYVRYATEEEKKKLFDKLAEEGYEWDSTKKELVKIKWKPKKGEFYWSPSVNKAVFEAFETQWSEIMHVTKKAGASRPKKSAKSSATDLMRR